MVGCGSSDDGPPTLPGANGGGPGTEPTQAEPCSDGDVRDCHVDLAEHNGVKSCFVGEQTCADGVWGPCGSDGTEPFGGVAKNGIGAKALGAAVDCSNNPCDPTCQTFNETPPDPVTAINGGTGYGWEQGSLNDFPPGLVSKGLSEPCQTGSDCQFDHYCSEPAQGSCFHSVCAEGFALEPTCNSCADEVCAVDPSCCVDVYSGSCKHDPCETGSKLKSNCDSCVQSICAVDPYCCNTAWDSICVGEVASVCGKTCGGSNSWDATCVDMVKDVCGAYCGSNPSSVKGQCLPWLPGATDSDCAGIDLTLGVTCEDSIPVCNRGNATAPAGIKIVHFPGNSNQYPQCAPDLSHPQTQQCFTTEEIPPGECINVTNCPGLSGNREIMVNPVDGTEEAECYCGNNWSLYSSSAGSCGPPTCAATKSEATIKKVNMFVAIDKSGSMAWNGWGATINALEAFFEAPESEGLGVALRFWPDSSPSYCGSSSCSINNCAQPMIDLGTLTADAAPTDAHEAALVAALGSKVPGGGTPMYAALGGATQWAKNFQAANPNEQAVVVFVTDGQPTECNASVDDIAGLAQDAFVTSGVRTYVVGIELDSATVATVDQIAAYGGTGSALLVPADNSPNSVNTDLVNALNAIKGDAIECEFALPPAGQFDPSAIELLYTSSGGTDSTLVSVPDQFNCGSGDWYFDDPADPTEIILCPTTCSTVQADVGGKLDVEIGCPGNYTSQVYTQTYQATCPSGTKPQWGFMAYDTYVPGDASIVFSARTGDTPAQVAAATPTVLSTATAGNEVCALGAPPCPVDLYSVLGGAPKARHDILEIDIEINPTTGNSATPIVNDWNVTYSCPFSE